MWEDELLFRSGCTTTHGRWFLRYCSMLPTCSSSLGNLQFALLLNIQVGVPWGIWWHKNSRKSKDVFFSSKMCRFATFIFFFYPLKADSSVTVLKQRETGRSDPDRQQLLRGLRLSIVVALQIQSSRALIHASRLPLPAQIHPSRLLDRLVKGEKKICFHGWMCFCSQWALC